MKYTTPETNPSDSRSPRNRHSPSVFESPPSSSKAPPPTTLPQSSSYPPLTLIIRFSTSLPDLPIPISDPSRTTANDLKPQIRPYLPPDKRRNRLRLIYAGKILADGAPLTVSIGRGVCGVVEGPPRGPPRRSKKNDRGWSYGGEDNDRERGGWGRYNSEEVATNKGNGKGKGKGRLENVEEGGGNEQLHTNTDPNTDITALTSSFSTPQPQIKHIYIHCSIGTIPSDAHQASPHTTTSLSSTRQSIQPPASSSTPQGFDRLVASNFTRDDVAALRTQFRSLLSYTHTPDTMPSRAGQRALEERWLDDSAPGGGYATRRPGARMSTVDDGGDDVALDMGYSLTDGPNTGSVTGTGTNTGFANGTQPAQPFTPLNDDDGSHEDIFLGNVLGFFWPVGALVWGLREEGVWTRRRQVSVLTGLLVNVAFGFLKMTS